MIRNFVRKHDFRARCFVQCFEVKDILDDQTTWILLNFEKKMKAINYFNAFNRFSHKMSFTARSPEDVNFGFEPERPFVSGTSNTKIAYTYVFSLHCKFSVVIVRIPC